VTTAQQAAGSALTSYAGSLSASAAQAAAAAAAQAAAQAKAAAAAAAAQQAAASRAQTGTVSEARLITDRANVANAEAALTKAQNNLAGSTLTAPMAGRVGSIAWAVGDTATAANGIQIVGSGAAKVTVQVPAANLPSIAVGQAAHVTVTGVPVMDGSVSQVALLPTTASGSSSSTYAVDVLVPAAPDVVGTGGRASVAIVITKVDGVLTVPASAVTGVGTGTGSVGLLKSGVVTATIVQIGAVGGGKVQILSGLSLGDTVVIGDASQPLPTNGGFGGFGGGIGGLTGGGGVRVPGAGLGGGAPPGGAPAGP
jgi:RND family efflux transporter MFP subunit